MIFFVFLTAMFKLGHAHSFSGFHNLELRNETRIFKTAFLDCNTTYST